MKMLKIFAVVALLTIAGFTISNYAVSSGEWVEVINLSQGDQVNKNKFTIVAKSGGHWEGDSLTVKVTIQNEFGDIVEELVNVTAR